MRMLLIVLVALMSGCAATSRKTAMIEFAPNQFYVEDFHTLGYAVTDQELRSRLKLLVEEVCSQVLISKNKVLRRTEALSPMVRCNKIGCADDAVQSATAHCLSKPVYNFESASDLQMYDLSKVEDRQWFHDYAVGDYWKGWDAGALRTFSDFGYPDVAYIDGYRKAFWFYNRPSGDVVIEFAGDRVPPMGGYRYYKQWIYLLSGESLDQIEFRPESVLRF